MPMASLGSVDNSTACDERAIIARQLQQQKRLSHEKFTSRRKPRRRGNDPLHDEPDSIVHPAAGNCRITPDYVK